MFNHIKKIKDMNGKSLHKYVSRGLAGKWKKFIKDETEAQIKKIKEWIEK